MFVYLIANHETGKYYVGQHKGNNLKQYLQKKFYEARHYLSRRSRSYALPCESMVGGELSPFTPCSSSRPAPS